MLRDLVQRRLISSISTRLPVLPKNLEDLRPGTSVEAALHTSAQSMPKWLWTTRIGRGHNVFKEKPVTPHKAAALAERFLA
jgi:hypothetical protein